MKALRGLVLLAAAVAGGACARPPAAGLAPGAPAAEVFRARLIEPYIQGIVTVRILIGGLSSPLEVLGWKQLVDGGDVKGFYRAFGKADRGRLEFSGGLGLSIKISAAQVTAAPGGGRKIELFGEAKSISRASRRSARRDFPFLAVVLEVGEDGRGEGRIYESVKLALSPQGTLVLQGFTNAPKLLTAVEPVQ